MAEAPGILLYDPNPTTAKLAAASLRVAGYMVHGASDEAEAVELAHQFGAAGDDSIVALLLDATADVDASTSLLRALIAVPGAAELPAVLIVSRSNPTPIAGAEELPTIRRPFAAPALIKVIAEVLADVGAEGPKLGRAAPMSLEGKWAAILSEQLGSPVSEPQAGAIRSALEAADQAHAIHPAATLRSRISGLRPESVLDMLARAGSTGIATITSTHATATLHLQDGRVRLAEYSGPEDFRLGRFVVESGLLDAAALDAFMAQPSPALTAGAMPRPLGLRLVDAGKMTEAELAFVLLAQAREVVCHILGWDDGDFSFEPTSQLHPLASASLAGQELTIAEALLDGLRRISDVAAMGGHMSDVDAVFVRVDETIAYLGREALARDELQVLELTNGRNSVKEIARRLRAGTYVVAQVLYRLDKAKVVRRKVDPVVA